MEVKEVKVRVEDKYVKWLPDIGKEDVKEAGGKAANLGEMIKLGLPVPPGFVINASGYLYFLEETGLKQEIYQKLKEIDIENTELLDSKAREIRDMITGKEMPEDLREEILEAYSVLGIDKDALKTVSKDVMNILKMQEPEFVAVRSSATAEDSSEASFAGQQETFLNVKGNSDVIDKVKKCFASLFTSRSVYYRVKKGFKHEEVLNAIIVQRMVNSDKSGVIFSKNPITGEDNVVIEAVFGLGEGIVSGKIKPDNYVVSKELEILNENIADKKIALVRNSAGKTEVVKLTEDKSKQKVLRDYEIKRLSTYAIRLENHYQIPQDIEFALDSGEIYIVQTRPITTFGKEIKRIEIKGKEILSGSGASPGIGSGKVRIILDLRDLNKIKTGDVLVAKMTSPDMVVTMQKSSAIVTDEGGTTSHAAIVSREMGIPAVVGTGNATAILKEGIIVTVDGFNGKVYEGEAEEIKSEKIVVEPVAETETKLKVIVDLPSFAERASRTNIKDVGLTRIEGIIAEGGKHPYYFQKQGNIKEYQELIFNGLNKIGDYFDEMWVRTSDIRSDEYMNLKGAPKEKEGNPMLGMHGIRDSLKHTEILKAELKAISDVKKKTGVILPQVVKVDEVRQVKKIIKELNLDVILGVMIETPASVEIINELCDEGIKFISFGTNDLTQYTLAVDRNNDEVQNLFDEMDPAVLRQLEHVIKICKKKNVETSICGQAGSKKEMVDFLVRLGIDSISVNADKAKEISEYVKNLEDKGLRGSALKEFAPPKAVNATTQFIPYSGDVKTTGQTTQEIKQKGHEKQKKSYEIICDECGKNSEVPFKPKPNLPVYCKSCYLKNKTKKTETDNAPAPEPPLDGFKDKTTEDSCIYNKTEEKQEEFPDLNYGFDIFSASDKEKHEAIEKEKKEVDEIKEDALTLNEEPEPQPEPVPEMPEPEPSKQEDMTILVDGEPVSESELEIDTPEPQSEPLNQLEEINEKINEKVEKASEDLKSNEEILDIF